MRGFAIGERSNSIRNRIVSGDVFQRETTLEK